MSIINKVWKLKSPAPQKFHDTYPGYSPVVRQLLWDRGLKKKKQIKQFLNPDYEKDLHSPFLLKGIDKAVARLQDAIAGGESILIYGDYDADGVCATTLLKQVFEELGAENVSFYIPHREEEGYGLHNQAIDQFIKDGVRLIVTVDCGSGNIEEVSHAEKGGIDVIVTDHHQVLSDKHSAYAFINPHQKGDEYPFKDLSGTGVAFKLAQALSLATSGVASDGYKKWLLDLVAVATVADVMPLTGENRTLVKYGLLVLAQTRRLGLRALMKQARITPTLNRKRATTNLSPRTLGFMLAPRLNAAGRMDHAHRALDLLVAQDEHTAQGLAADLETLNKERQTLVRNILKEVDIDSVGDGACIIEGRPHWPIGVLGIVAGRLADQHHKPAFIYQKQGNKLVGSARAPDGFNTVALLEASSEHLIRFGGHEGAGGFTAEIGQEDALCRALSAAASRYADKAGATKPFIEIEATLDAVDISFDTYEEFTQFEPHGEGNAKPVFLLKDAILENVRNVGTNASHFKCDIVGNEETRFSAIGFSLAEAAAVLEEGNKVNVLFNLEIDEWNGSRKLSLRLVDIRKTH